MWNNQNMERISKTCGIFQETELEYGGPGHLYMVSLLYTVNVPLSTELSLRCCIHKRNWRAGRKVPWLGAIQAI